MVSRITAFVMWALVAAVAAFWGLRLFVKAPAAPPHVIADGSISMANVDFSRLLGATPVNAPAATAAPEASSRFQLTGVMAPKGSQTSSQGVALIAVDGKPPRAYRIGGRVDGDWVLQSVALRTASLGPVQGNAAVVLELPPLPAPATGTLPAPPAPQAP
jgi:general secretion pathway protein C